MSDRDPHTELDVDAERVRAEHMDRVDPRAHLLYLVSVLLGATVLMVALLALLDAM
jgi:hypothetical protein